LVKVKSEGMLLAGAALEGGRPVRVLEIVLVASVALVILKPTQEFPD
jgi:hypothetical protein